MLAVILVACDNGINGDTTPPGPVTNLDANAGDGQVTLTWNDPTDADLDSIEITWTPGGTTPQVVTKGTKSATIKGLTNGTPYTFTVKAKDNATPPNINQGETITAKPAAQPDTTSPDTQPDTTSPGPVTSLNATVGDKWVTLTWNDPPDADLDSIEITWTPPDGNTPLTVAKETQSATINGLTNGTDYTFTVKAKDNATPPNTNQGETIIAKPAAQPDTTSPDPVTSLNATVGDKWVTLTWNDPPDADLDSIEITWTPPDGNTPLTVAKETQSATINGLTNGTDYTFTVKAKDNATPPNTNQGETIIAKPSQSGTPSQSGAQVKVNFTGPQDETINLSQDAESLSHVANATISISVSGSFTDYKWFLDGVFLEGATGSSISANTGELAIKQHELTVFVTTSSGVEYAKSMYFIITE